MSDFENHLMSVLGKIVSSLSHFWDPNDWVGIIFYAVVFFVSAMMLSRLIRTATTRILLREENALIDRTVVMFLMQFAQIAVYIVGLIVFFHVIPMLNKLGTALLTGVSVMSVVFGLAAQNTLSNLVAGVTLLLYRPFHIDDLIQVATPTGTESGIVERLTLGYTMLRTMDDRLVIVPNSLMASQVSLNLNRRALHTMLIVPVGVMDNANINAVRAALIDAAKHSKGIHKIINCRSQAFDEGSGVILSLRAWCDSTADLKKLEQTIVETVRARFKPDDLFSLAPSKPAIAKPAAKAA